MNELGNGHLEERVSKTEAETLWLREEFHFVRGELKDIKTTLDLILKTLQLYEEKDDA